MLSRQQADLDRRRTRVFDRIAEDRAGNGGVLQVHRNEKTVGFQFDRDRQRRIRKVIDSEGELAEEFEALHRFKISDRASLQSPDLGARALLGPDGEETVRHLSGAGAFFMVIKDLPPLALRLAVQADDATADGTHRKIHGGQIDPFVHALVFRIKFFRCLKLGNPLSIFLQSLFIGLLRQKRTLFLLQLRQVLSQARGVGIRRHRSGGLRFMNRLQQHHIDHRVTIPGTIRDR